MTHDDALLQAIIENPDDDGPRLVYADWLEERGDPRAEFIRVQCRLVALPESDPLLEARERDLLAEHGDEWARPLPRIVAPHEFERGFLSGVELPAKAYSQLATVLACHPTVRRLWLVGPFKSGKPTMGVIAESPYLPRLSSLHINKGYYYLGSAAVGVLAA